MLMPWSTILVPMSHCLSSAAGLPSIELSAVADSLARSLLAYNSLTAHWRPLKREGARRFHRQHKKHINTRHNIFFSSQVTVVDHGDRGDQTQGEYSRRRLLRWWRGKGHGWVRDAVGGEVPTPHPRRRRRERRHPRPTPRDRRGREHAQPHTLRSAGHGEGAFARSLPAGFRLSSFGRSRRRRCVIFPFRDTTDRRAGAAGSSSSSSSVDSHVSSTGPPTRARHWSPCIIFFASSFSHHSSLTFFLPHTHRPDHERPRAGEAAPRLGLLQRGVGIERVGFQGHRREFHRVQFNCYLRVKLPSARNRTLSVCISSTHRPPHPPL